ncbi:helix-turn-helix domain-containing protein [Limosilactobacillus fermentum]|uniref:helix-turn-helix transcriptional regulator n=1 Tax=Limosilactobacillus sp. TaxID=2773925 RepID=UPI0030F361A8
MFGKNILNGKQLCEKLGISTTLLYRLLKQGMPYHQLSTGSRKYYNIDEVQQWLLHAGFHQQTTWTK